MRQQSEPSAVFDRIMSALTTPLILVAPVANLSAFPSILVPASIETATISLSSPVTSTLASSQDSSSQCLSFEDPCHGRETNFKLHLRSGLPKKNSRCRGNCHKTITQSDRLLVRSYGISSWLDHKTGEERSRDELLYIHFQDNCLKHMTVKIIMSLMNSLITNKSSWMKEPERKYLMLTLSIVYLQDLGINYVRYQKLRFVFIDLFVNCVYTRHQFRNFLFLELLLKRT